jgi:[NiFe] hydrogenase assembly HybE family chaperone
MNAAADLAAAGRALEQAYTRIGHTRMRGLPIVNPALRVELVGLRAWDGGAVGVIVTPWCMNLVVLPLPGGRDIPATPVGTVHVVRLPAGNHDLLAAQLPETGPHLSGSLCSPMGDFASQDQAVAAAREALDLLFDARPAPADAPDPAPGNQASRRGFLLGRLPR